HKISRSGPRSRGPVNPLVSTRSARFARAAATAETFGMFIGDILVAHKLVTPADVAAAVEVQKREGGRVGDILVAQGKLSAEALEAVMHGAPTGPRTLAESGLGLPTLLNLLIKAMYAGAAETPSGLAKFLKLPHRPVQHLVEQAQHRKLLDV